MTSKWMMCGALAAVLAALTGCWKADGPAAYVLNSQARGRPVTLRLSAADAQFSGTLNQIVIRAVERAVESCDATIHESDIAKLNRIGVNARIQISRETYRLLDLARHYAVLSGGSYDFTVAPVAYLWGFEGAPVPTNVPPDDLRQTAMLGVGPNNISFFDNGSVTLTHEQTRVSVASLVDAYCADMAIVEARQKSIANGYVRVGNSARALGSNDDASWFMRLPDPFGSGGPLGMVRVEPGRAISAVLPKEKTVGIAEKSFSSIINPKTGLPVEGIALTAAYGNIATKCSVIAQALAVVGVEGAADVLKNFPGCEALIVPDRKPVELWMTPGFALQADFPEALRDNFRTIEVPIRAGSVEALSDELPALPMPVEK